MTLEIQPGVVCAVVPPPDDRGETVRNRFVTVLRREHADFFRLNGAFVWRLPFDIVWWCHCATPVETIHGTVSEIPLPQDWLRPISGPDIDIGEHVAEPLRDETLAPKPQVEHAR